MPRWKIAELHSQIITVHFLTSYYFSSLLYPKLQMFIVRVSLIEQGLVDDMEPEWLLIFLDFFLFFRNLFQGEKKLLGKS